MKADNLTGWAIVNPNGMLEVVDGCWPVYWYRKVANRERLERGLLDCRIVKVRAVPVLKKRKRRA